MSQRLYTAEIVAAKSRLGVAARWREPDGVDEARRELNAILLYRAIEEGLAQGLTSEQLGHAIDLLVQGA